MIALDVQIRKDGLKVEAKGKGIFWISTISFFAGLVRGGSRISS
jgi:hypothetical protein